MDKTKKCFAFLDTNIFLEYEEFTQIDWRTVTKSQNVCLVVTRINMQELDDFKYDPKSQRRQRRSRSVSKKILDILQDSGTTEAEVPERPGVTLRYLTNFPNLENFRELKSNNNDDLMIAAILEFKATNSPVEPESIILISADTGPQLLALHYEIKSIRLDDKYQLQPEPNQTEKRLKKLEKEFAEINQQPKVLLEIAGSMNNDFLVIEQSQRNEKQSNFLALPSHKLESQLNTVKRYYQNSKRVKVNRNSSGNSLFSTPNIIGFTRDLTIGNELGMPIWQYVEKVGMDFHFDLLMPVDVYAEAGDLGIYHRPTPKGNDAEWFNSVYDFYRVCKEDAEERFNSISNCTHFTIELTVNNIGSVALKELSLEVHTSDFNLTRILPQFETPKSDREKAAPAYKSIASDEKPEMYGTVENLSYYSKLLRPKNSEQIIIGYLVVPYENLKGEFQVILSAENLIEPIVKVISVTFDQPIGKFEQEAIFYKELFDS